jgi:hypothetical protein
METDRMSCTINENDTSHEQHPAKKLNIWTVN